MATKKTRAKTSRSRRPTLTRAGKTTKSRSERGRKGGVASGKARRTQMKAKGSTMARRATSRTPPAPPTPTA